MTRTSRSSSRRPPPGPRPSDCRSPAGACGSWAPTCPGPTSTSSPVSDCSGCQAGGCGSAGNAAPGAARQRHHLSANPDLEGVHGRRLRRQAGPDRARGQRFPRSMLRVRPVRAVVDPPPPRIWLGSRQHAGPAAGDLPAHPRHPLLPRLLQPRRSAGDDLLWGVVRAGKGGDHTLAALKSIRAARPDGAPVYVILDNLSANTTPAVRRWAAAHRVELCLTPTYSSWANPIEAQFGPLRTFTMANSNYPNHTVFARDLQAHLRWRNTHARHPDVLAAQRRERARIRSEKGHRWGRPKIKVEAA